MRNRIVTAVKQRFSIRKLSIGAASVLLGTSLYFMGGSATIVHAGTNVSGDVPQTGTTKADVQVEPASGQTGEENGSTEVKDPVKVAKAPTKDDTDVNQAIDDYANQKQKEQDEAGNKVVIRPSGKQPEKAADNATDRGTKVEDIKDSIDDGIAAANNDKAAIEDYKNKHQNQQILQGEESGAFKNQGLSVDDEKGSEIKNITITDKDKKTVYTYTPAIDGPSHNIEIDGKKDAIVITHTNNKTDKETNTMKINSDNKVIVDFQHDQCQGKEITVTYDNLKNSYYLENIDNKTNKIKISKIERTFLGIYAGDTIFTSDGHTPTSDGVYDKCYGPQLIIYNDPYDGFFYNNIKQVSVKDIYYDDKGNPITFKDGDKNKAWIFVTSLNSDGVGNNNHRGDGKEYLEKVKAENPDDTPAEMKKIAGSTVTGPVDENTTKDFTRTVELVDGHSNGDYLRNYLRTNKDDLKNQGWIWQEHSSELTQTVTLHVKKTNDGYVYDNADAFFKGLTLPPISENGTEKYPAFEIPEVRVGTNTAVRIRISYSASNSSTPKPLDKTKFDADEEKVPDTHDGWWYSDESNSPQNNYPDWDNKSEDNRYAFVGTVAIQYQPGMTITYGADDTAWGSHWACTQTQVVSTLNERVIIYGHIK
ncbi:YSIRK-type signal peptide-containing protein, partial [Lactobacillus amylovorus]|nr:YSIRK-type signal peptide-containing protein [Lactobacillus amylovorus]